MVRTSVTHLKEHLATLEAKETLTSNDLLSVESLLKKIEALGAAVQEHHYAVINLIGDDEQKMAKNKL